MLNPIIHKFKYGQDTVVLETGAIARQANASVMASIDNTTVFVTVVFAKQLKPEQRFFPLVINYQERTYAAGKFPGGFFRREGRPSENEVLISRLIDRPVRPLFPNGFFYEVQVIATVVSVNPQINPDIVAIIGTSAALSLSGVPFNGPIGAARVGYIDGKYILNPKTDHLIHSELDLVISGTEDSILMVEAEAKCVNEYQMLNAITFGYEQQKIVIDNINQLVSRVGNKTKWDWSKKEVNDVLKNRIVELSESRLSKAYSIRDKQNRYHELSSIRNDLVNVFLHTDDSLDENIIMDIIYNIEKRIVRNRILEDKIRIDGRSSNVIRDLDIRVGLLPRVHGSALFTRGETQALVTVTLGTERDAQNIDDLTGDRIDRFLLHYNFPSYCVGEIGMLGLPKRREIGHGRLAKRGILAVMPKADEFPYTIRVVSEITESNGSSSMASICGASLALMDAGVPIKSAIAGISMGLIKEEDKFVILSDILSDEDYLGDMDFKVAGSVDGITALQMDIKIHCITNDIIRSVLFQAKEARLHILSVMNKIMKLPRKEVSKFAPCVHIIKINPDKIRDIIGKGGSVIRSLTEKTGATIEVDNDGSIKVMAMAAEKVNFAVKCIKEITDDITVGVVYNGIVTHIVDFGAFVSICGRKEGLVHISQMSNKRVNKVSDYLKIGQDVLVKVLEIDRQGRIRLSIKAVDV